MDNLGKTTETMDTDIINDFECETGVYYTTIGEIVDIAYSSGLKLHPKIFIDYMYNIDLEKCLFWTIDKNNICVPITEEGYVKEYNKYVEIDKWWFV